MACDTYFDTDIRAALVAGLVMAIHSDGGHNVEYLRGTLAMACHTATVFGIAWPGLLASAQGILGNGIGVLLDASTPVLEGQS